jgi:GntR family transcriptional regulator
MRLQSIDDIPIMVKRTTFPQWLIPTIAQLPEDARSIMEVVERAHGPQLAYGEHLISAVLPDSEDARLLGVSRTTPLLRVQRAARTFDGRPFEYSDDRYLATATSLSVVNSAPNGASPSVQ